MSIPCSNCGRLNRPGARYCASCRAPLSATSARLQPGQLLDGGTYRVERSLGKGGMGAVWLVAQTKAFDRLAVIKEVIDYFDPTDAEERQKALQRFEAEARTLGDLKHPGIPDLYAYFSAGGHNYLVMEYIEGADLRKGLTREDTATGQLTPGGPLPASQVLGYTIQICEVLEYLARRQPVVVHNDIKPGNIIVDEHSGRAVLVDFGTAETRYLQTGGQPDGDQADVYGTVGYAAPELYRGHSEPRSDVYSLAATAYHLLTDDDPRDHPFQYPQLEVLSPRLGSILRAALVNEIRDRLTATRFRQQLEHYLAGETAPRRPLASARNAAGIATASSAASPVAGAPLPPKMKVLTPSLRLGAVGQGGRVQEEIRIANQGGGYLHGEVFASQPWIKVGDDTFTCAPGQRVVLPLEIDTAGLSPDQMHEGGVTLMPAGGNPEEIEVIPVQLAVTAPAIEVAPAEIDFGAVSRRDLSTPRRSVTVTNVSQAVARCRILGAPEWLLIKPQSFGLQPGAKQDVELVGRVNKIQGRRHEFPLKIAPDGGQDRVLRVMLRIKGGLFG